MFTLGRSIFDNIYNLPFLISYYNFMCGMINPDGFLTRCD